MMELKKRQIVKMLKSGVALPVTSDLQIKQIGVSRDLQGINGKLYIDENRQMYAEVK